MKDLHIQIPKKLFEEFYLMFPGHGERKAILIQFIKEAIRLQHLKHYFSETVAKSVYEQMKEES